MRRNSTWARVGMAALLLACSLGAQADARLAEETSHLINTIRQKLDACGEEGSLGTLQLQATAQPASLTARVATRPALAFSTRLAAVAARHARSMAEQQFFDHTDPQGKTVGHRATEAGYRWRVVGENLAAGHETIGDAVRGWLLSTGHCQNLIDPRFNEFGIARVSASSLSDPYGSYWVLVLGRSSGNDVASR